MHKKFHLTHSHWETHIHSLLLYLRILGPGWLTFHHMLQVEEFFVYFRNLSTGGKQKNNWADLLIHSHLAAQRLYCLLWRRQSSSWMILNVECRIVLLLGCVVLPCVALCCLWFLVSPSDGTWSTIFDFFISAQAHELACCAVFCSPGYSECV